MTVFNMVVILVGMVSECHRYAYYLNIVSLN